MVALLVLSEGARDIGRGDGAHQGAVRVLARAVIDAHVGRSTADHEVLAAPLPRAHQKDRGPRRRVQLALGTMHAFQCKSVAIVVDADGYPERLGALTAERDVDERQAGALPVALGVAVETVEAWLLADESAINGALAPSPPAQAQPSPESIWAPPRTPGHPKSIFERFIASRTREVDAPYDAVASRARLGIVENRCPSFRAFAQELRARTR